MPLTILKTWASRMIKAVFFDWFFTLARFKPSRDQLYRETFRVFGIKLSPEKVMRGILTADQYFFEENAKFPVTERAPEEQIKLYVSYPNMILAEAGVKAPRELTLAVLKRVREQFKGASFTLFSDVLPTLETLDTQNLVLGLLTNLDSDMSTICRKMGLEDYLDFVVTAKEAGADKPNPSIFLSALKKAGVNASEAMHVGDQYTILVTTLRAIHFLERFSILWRT